MKQVRTSIIPGLMAILLFQDPAGVSAAEEVKPLLARIKTVNKKGEGNVEAARAWRELCKCGPDALIDILTSLNDANPTAANWLRSAVEAVVDRALSGSKKLPAAKLEAFVQDTKNAGPARRLAFDCLVQVDKSAEKRLIPGMLDDPSGELRRDAVELVIRGADLLFEKKELDAAAAAYRIAFAAARDKDQVEHVAKRLGELKVSVDLTKHFNFVTRWMVIGPFDNTAGSGFKKVYAPEKGVDLSATLAGKDKKDLRWTEHVTNLPYGMVDLNKAIGKEKASVAYAFTAVNSEKERPIQIRAGSNNAIKLFLNGKEVFFREEYHHGMRMDQHVGAGVLKQGRNEILVKICQNTQTEPWAQLWSFQVRVCDAIGGAVPVQVVVAKPNRPTKDKE